MFWSKTTQDPAREKRNLLKTFGLSESAENILIERMTEHLFKKGEIVVREGDIGNAMYFVASGSLVVLKRNKSGQEVEIAQMGVGDFFGEVSLLKNEPRTSTVIAAEDCRLYQVEKKRSVDFLIATNPELKNELEKALQRHLKNDNVKLR